MGGLNETAVELARARLEETRARDRLDWSRRRQFALLNELHADELALARARVVRLEAGLAAVVRGWIAANLKTRRG